MKRFFLLPFLLKLINSSPIPENLTEDSKPSIKAFGFKRAIEILARSDEAETTADKYVKHQIPQVVYNEATQSAMYDKISSCLEYKIYDKKNELYSETPETLANRCIERINGDVNGLCSSLQILKVLQHESTIYTNRGYVGIDHSKRRIVLVFNGSRTWIDGAIDIFAAFAPYSPRVKSSGMEGLEQLNNTEVNTLNAAHKVYEKHCVKGLGCLVHSGFYKSMKSLFNSHYKAVTNALNDNPGYDLWITGHSLGSAMASMTAVDYKLAGFKPVVITTGGPRVGNDGFANFHNELFQTKRLHDAISSGSDSKYLKEKKNHGAMIRIRHKSDMVVHLPSHHLGYFHPGVELCITKKNFPHTRNSVKTVKKNFKALKPETPDPEDYDHDNGEGFNNDDFYPDDGEYAQGMGIDNASIAYIPDWMRKAHAQYFITVTSCRSQSELKKEEEKRKKKLWSRGFKEFHEYIDDQYIDYSAFL